LLIARLSRIGSNVVPRKVIEEIGWDAFVLNPVGTGPFRLVSWVRDDHMVLEAFDDHWRGRPEWDQLVFRFISEDSTRVAELMTGGVDIAVNIPPQDAERIASSGLAVTTPQPTSRVAMLFVNSAADLATGDV